VARLWQAVWTLVPDIVQFLFVMHAPLIIYNPDSHTRFSAFYHGGMLQNTPLPALASQHSICWLYLDVCIQIANKLGNLKKIIYTSFKLQYKCSELKLKRWMFCDLDKGNFPITLQKISLEIQVWNFNCVVGVGLTPVGTSANVLPNVPATDGDWWRVWSRRCNNWQEEPKY
jgi:hypothetical protein